MLDLLLVVIMAGVFAFGWFAAGLIGRMMENGEERPRHGAERPECVRFGADTDADEIAREVVRLRERYGRRDVIVCLADDTDGTKTCGR